MTARRCQTSQAGKPRWSLVTRDRPSQTQSCAQGDKGAGVEVRRGKMGRGGAAPGRSVLRGGLVRRGEQQL
eukprot:364293-Chlamydomonas_euryale.AAC.8